MSSLVHGPTFARISRAFSQVPPGALVLAAGAAVYWSRQLLQNYRAFLALGASNIPYNAVLWLINLLFRPLTRETISTSMYDRDSDKSIWLKDPDTIPERRGTRVRTGWHFLPHRQVEKFPSKEFAEKTDSMVFAHAHANPLLVKVTKSPHESRLDGLVLHPSLPTPHKVAKEAWREMVHVHPNDHSLHVILSPQDCKLVIERGWGERHPLSGLVALPKEYLLIYAPRNEEELEVVERIVVASIAFVSGNREAV